MPYGNGGWRVPARLTSGGTLWYNVVVEETPMLTITPKALEKMLTVLKDPARKSYGLRLSAKPMGAALPQYGLSLVEKETPGLNDQVLTVDSIKIYFDRLSLPYVEGATIDYTTGGNGEGFMIKTPYQPAKPPEAPAELPTGPDAEAIQKVLDEQINPGVAGHGGHVSLVAVKDHVVYVKMGGGCQGCGMASVTLTQGIIGIVKKALPHITDVRDVTDHAGGTNPYYQPDK